MYTDEWRILFMFKIVEKKSLNPTVSKITVEAPLIAKKAEPGQFIVERKKKKNGKDNTLYLDRLDIFYRFEK